MDSRLSALIADVQSRIHPRDEIPLGVQPRWPGASALLEGWPTETINDGSLEQGENQRSPAGKREDSLLSESAWVGFPEHVSGADVLINEVPPLQVDSVDTLAYYLPFHFFRRWGIYVREEGLLQLAREIFENRYQVPVSADVALAYAYQILLKHELFHHYVEVAVARLDHLGHCPASTYEGFFNNKVAAEREEALANAFALRKADTLHPMARRMRGYVAEWMGKLGPGYRDFRSVSGNRFATAKDALVDLIALHQTTRVLPLLVAGRLLYRDIDPRSVPVHIVFDAGGVLGIARPLPSWGPLTVWTWSNDHKPPHVHASDKHGKGGGSGVRFTWPGCKNMDAAPKKIERMFADYAGRYAARIGAEVDRITWK